MQPEILHTIWTLLFLWVAGYTYLLMSKIITPRTQAGQTLPDLIVMGVITPTLIVTTTLGVCNLMY